MRQRAAEVACPVAGLTTLVGRRRCRRPCRPPSRRAAPSGGTSGCRGRTRSAGKVCRIQMPPRSWKLIAFCLSSVSTKTSANALTTSETSLETLASCGVGRVGLEPLLVDVAGEGVGRRDRHDRRRHERADRDRREGDAGEPAGNESSNSCGMTSCALGLPSRPIGLVPAAIATQPSRASRPSTKRVRRQDRGVAADRVAAVEPTGVAVIECGYMNSASAEPSAERGVGPVLAGARDERAGRLAGGRVGASPSSSSAAPKMRVPAAELRRAGR